MARQPWWSSRTRGLCSPSTLTTALRPPSSSGRLAEPRTWLRPRWSVQDLFVPEGHPLADRNSVELSEAAAESWIVTRHDNDSYALLTVACASAGFTARVVHEAKEWYAVSALVSEALGICLLPRMVPIPADHRVVRVPLASPSLLSRRIITCVRRGSSHHPVIRTGLDALSSTAGSEHSPPG